MVMALPAGSPPSLSAAFGPARRSVMDMLATMAQHWVFLAWSACCLIGKHSRVAAQQVPVPRSLIIVKSHRRLLQVQGHQKSRMFPVVSLRIVVSFRGSARSFAMIVTLFRMLTRLSWVIDASGGTAFGTCKALCAGYILPLNLSGAVPSMQISVPRSQ